MEMMAPFLLNSLMNFAVALMVAKALGPSEYGRFMLALAVAVVFQTLVFDWLRLAATRFYAERDRHERPEIRSTLDAAFAALAGFAVLLSFSLWILRPRLQIAPDLAALAVGASLSNASFDVSAALLRARFQNRAYGALVIAKNGLALIFTVGGAFVFRSAEAALIGMMASVAGAVVVARRTLIDPGTSFHKAEAARLRRYLAYGLPIILAAVLYQSVPLANRALLSRLDGFAEVGLLSLAFETGVRVVGAVGSAIDVVLFQIAVHRETTLGADAGRAQISRNLGVVFALLLPAVAGAWLILPSFEALFAPRAFHGAFAAYFALMTPAFFAFGMLNYGVATAFQLAHRLAPLVIAALVAVIANLLSLALLPPAPGAARFAAAQSISSMSGLMALVTMLFLLEPVWPRARDIFGAIAATAVMIGAGLPLRALPPGATSLSLQLVVGAGVYGALAFAFDIGGLRSVIGLPLSALRRRRKA
jgi:O-antigen/teichoic acid export membrane protein